MMDEFIGKYKVLRNIGAGGMASVYLASHRDVPNLKNILKKLSDPKLADRFKREADKLALLDGHVGICQIKHFFEHSGDLYIVMEYIDGSTLDQLIKSDDPPNLKRSLEITRSILGTLDFAHRKGIIHRDIKPTNIMIDGNGQVKIIDFGIAKGTSDPELTQAGTSLGSPRYMAPEQFDPPDSVDWVRCDLYAVGVTLYYLLARKPPFEGANMFELCAAKRLNDLPPPSKFNSDIPAELDAVVMKAIACDPAERYATATEMEAALKGMESTARVKVEGGSDKTMVLDNVHIPEPRIKTARPPTPAPFRDDSRSIPPPPPPPRPSPPQFCSGPLESLSFCPIPSLKRPNPRPRLNPWSGPSGWATRLKIPQSYLDGMPEGIRSTSLLYNTDRTRISWMNQSPKRFGESVINSRSPLHPAATTGASGVAPPVHQTENGPWATRS